MSSVLFPDQPVWEWIAARQPDHLVLLGDSIYLDVPVTEKHPMDMTDDESKRDLLGETQLTQLAGAMQAAPQAVHILASGPTLDSWKRHHALLHVGLCLA